MNSFKEIEHRFENNIQDVYKLIEFDSLILKHTLRMLNDLDAKLRKLNNIDNPNLLPGNAIKNITNIQTNKSLRPHYKTMYNQSIVLLVSLFASAISDLFKEGLNQLAQTHSSTKLTKKELDSFMKEELKLTVKEVIAYGGTLSEHIGDIIADKQGISFQDMKSINRAFRTFFSFDIEHDFNVNNIIIAQASRHVIVHSGAIVNQRTLNQVSKAQPRSVKSDLSDTTHIQFEPSEIKEVGESMLAYFKALKRKTEECLTND